ncbi:ABC transporter permease [Cytobacillus oceanisediminis]|uniref:ABC transporter permease n=1 Tax=Cytobacillus oceanisediminis TaxID=665099 RepID=UPI00203D8E38|nr:ABC transporter permease subunit [Cytobacillus oceanisediminis]
MLNKMNAKLVLGVLLFGSFILISLIGPLIAPYEVDYNKKIGYIQTVDGQQLVSSPFPPSQEFILGTDKWGYDILTLMLHGAKYTVLGTLLIAIARVFLGGIAGILMGLYKKERTLRKATISVWSGIPTFVIIYFIMVGININSSIPIWGLVLIQSALMIFLGVSSVYNVILSKTAELKKELYVVASKTLGASNSHLMVKHIWPALKGNVMIILINEAILVLHLIGQLGIFNLFFGGTHQQFFPTIYLSVTHEWSGLIGQARGFMYHSQWIILFPLLAYIMFLISLYLISSGLSDIQFKKVRKASLL